MNQPFQTEKSVLQRIKIPALDDRKIRLFVKRDDLIHPEVSGNKWRKLKYQVLQAQQEKQSGILTFGGAYSNHLLATASACNALGLRSKGIVRGEELGAASNETLKRCTELGMQLEFVSREYYGLRNDYELKKEIRNENPGYFLVPEGGASYYGMIGCQEIWKEIPEKPDHLFLALGTGTTTAGLLMGKPAPTTVHAVPVLKGFNSEEEIERLYHQSGINNEIISEWMKDLRVHPENHFGGYGKTTPEMQQFIEKIKIEHQLPLDKVYTAKAFYGLLHELQSPEYDHTTVIFLHTGGLQGNT